MAQEESLYLHSYSDTCVVAPKDGVEVKHYCSRTGMEYQESARRSFKDDRTRTLQAFGDRYGKPRTSGGVSRQNSGKIRRQDLAIFSNPIYLEIFDKTAGKKTLQLHFVCEHFQIPLSNSVAAGDAENDISMLQAAGTAVAMANATPEVKACADFITQQDNDHDGLSEAILQLFEM